MFRSMFAVLAFSLLIATAPTPALAQGKPLPKPKALPTSGNIEEPPSGNDKIMQFLEAAEKKNLAFQEKVLTRMDRMEGKIDGLNTRMTNVETDVKFLKEDNVVIKADLKLVKENQLVMMGDIAIIKKNQKEMQEQLDRLDAEFKKAKDSGKIINLTTPPTKEYVPEVVYVDRPVFYYVPSTQNYYAYYYGSWYTYYPNYVNYYYYPTYYAPSYASYSTYSSYASHRGYYGVRHRTRWWY